MIQINHVTQPCTMSCLSACIAMITGLDVETVVEDFHHRYQQDFTHVTTSQYLESLGLPHTKDVSFNAEGLLSNDLTNVYAIVTSCSLNYADGLHAVMMAKVDRGDHTSDYIAYDPQLGNAGKHYGFTVDSGDRAYLGVYEESKEMPPLATAMQSTVIPCVDLYVKEQDIIDWRAKRGIETRMNPDNNCLALYEKAVAANTYEFTL